MVVVHRQMVVVVEIHTMHLVAVEQIREQLLSGMEKEIPTIQ